MVLRELEHIHLTVVGFRDEGLLMVGGGVNDMDAESTQRQSHVLMLMLAGHRTRTKLTANLIHSCM